MGYDGKLLSRAYELLGQRSAQYERELDERERYIEEKFPRIRELNIEIRLSIIRVINQALAGDGDAGVKVARQHEINSRLRKERSDILMTNGYPSNYLDREPICPFCSDTGYVSSGVCSCLLTLYKKEQIKELTYSIGIRPCSFENVQMELFADTHEDGARISARENIQYICHVCRVFLEKWHTPQNLFFSGAAGTGKTFIAACLAYSAVEAGISVMYENAGRLLGRYEDARFRRDDDLAKNDIARYENCDILILDDLGTEIITSVTNAGLYQLLNNRLTTGKACVFITNQTPDELRRKYPAQILSRLEGEFESLNFFGRDIRKNKRVNFL